MPSSSPGLRMDRGKHGQNVREDSESGRMIRSGVHVGASHRDHEASHVYHAVPGDEAAVRRVRERWEPTVSRFGRGWRRGIVFGAGICLAASVALLVLHESGRPAEVEMVNIFNSQPAQDPTSSQLSRAEQADAKDLGLEGTGQEAQAELNFASKVKQEENVWNDERLEDSWAQQKADALANSLAKIASRASRSSSSQQNLLEASNGQSQAVEPQPGTGIVEAEPVRGFQGPADGDGTDESAAAEKGKSGASPGMQPQANVFHSRDNDIDWDTKSAPTASATQAHSPSHAAVFQARDDGIDWDGKAKAFAPQAHAVSNPSPAAASTRASSNTLDFPDALGQFQWVPPAEHSVRPEAGGDTSKAAPVSQQAQAQQSFDNRESAFDWARGGRAAAGSQVAEPGLRMGLQFNQRDQSIAWQDAAALNHPPAHQAGAAGVETAQGAAPAGEQPAAQSEAGEKAAPGSEEGESEEGAQGGDEAAEGAEEAESGAQDQGDTAGSDKAAAEARAASGVDDLEWPQATESGESEEPAGGAGSEGQEGGSDAPAAAEEASSKQPEAASTAAAKAGPAKGAGEAQEGGQEAGEAQGGSSADEGGRWGLDWPDGKPDASVMNPNRQPPPNPAQAAKQPPDASPAHPREHEDEPAQSAAGAEGAARRGGEGVRVEGGDPFQADSWGDRGPVPPNTASGGDDEAPAWTEAGDAPTKADKAPATAEAGPRKEGAAAGKEGEGVGWLVTPDYEWPGRGESAAANASRNATGVEAAVAATGHVRAVGGRTWVPVVQVNWTEPASAGAYCKQDPTDGRTLGGKRRQCEMWEQPAWGRMKSMPLGESPQVANGCIEYMCRSVRAQPDKFLDQELVSGLEDLRDELAQWWQDLGGFVAMLWRKLTGRGHAHAASAERSAAQQLLHGGGTRLTDHIDPLKIPAGFVQDSVVTGCMYPFMNCQNQLLQAKRLCNDNGYWIRSVHNFSCTGGFIAAQTETKEKWNYVHHFALSLLLLVIIVITVLVLRARWLGKQPGWLGGAKADTKEKEVVQITL